MVVTHWDTVAVSLDAAQRAVWAAGDATDACLDWLAPAFPPHAERVVDIGCGVGRLAIPFAQRHPEVHVVGLDPSAQMLRWASGQREKVGGRWNLRFVLGDASCLPDLGLFDGAYSMVTFQHLPSFEQERYVRAVAAALRPGGVFRFQWQTHGDTGPLCHPVPEQVMEQWCASAGLVVTDLSHGFVWDPAPPWGWITAVRP